MKDTYDGHRVSILICIYTRINIVCFYTMVLYYSSILWFYTNDYILMIIYYGSTLGSTLGWLQDDAPATCWSYLFKCFIFYFLFIKKRSKFHLASQFLAYKKQLDSRVQVHCN